MLKEDTRALLDYLQKNKEAVYSGSADAVKGVLAGALGVPVDLTLLAMRPFGYNTPSKDVVGSTDWFGKVGGADTDSLAFLGGQFASPSIYAGAIPKAARFLPSPTKVSPKTAPTSGPDAARRRIIKALAGSALVAPAAKLMKQAEVLRGMANVPEAATAVKAAKVGKATSVSDLKHVSKLVKTFWDNEGIGLPMDTQGKVNVDSVFGEAGTFDLDALEDIDNELSLIKRDDPEAYEILIRGADGPEEYKIAQKYPRVHRATDEIVEPWLGVGHRSYIEGPEAATRRAVIGAGAGAAIGAAASKLGKIADSAATATKAAKVAKLRPIQELPHLARMVEMQRADSFLAKDMPTKEEFLDRMLSVFDLKRLNKVEDKLEEVRKVDPEAFEVLIQGGSEVNPELIESNPVYAELDAELWDILD